MIKRNLLVGLCSLGILFPLCTNATNQQIDWTPVTNCMGLASNLSNLLQDSSLTEIQAVPIDESTYIDDGITEDYSSSYFVDYNGKERLITVLLGPKDPKGSSVDFKYAKKIGKIKLPVGFSNVRTRIYNNNYLMILMEHLDYDRRVETVALFYDLTDSKIVPYYYFTHTGKIIKLHEQEGKLFVIFNSPFDKTTAQSFIKKDGNLPGMFPKFAEGVKYGLDPQEKVSVCRDYNYLQMPSNQLPSFWSIMVLNLNNLKISKDIYHLFGTISQFAFTEKAMYITVPGDGGTTIVQKFGIDPKINPQKSVLIDVPVLDGGVYAQDMRLAFIIKRASGKINQYSLLPFDSSFTPGQEKVLYTSEEDFTNVEYHSNAIFLRSKEKLVSVGELSTSGISTHNPIELPLREHKYFLFGTSPFSLIDVSTSDSKMSFSVVEMDKTQGKFKQISKARYPGECSLIGPISWNIKTRILLAPVKLQGTPVFEGLKGLQFSTKGVVSEIMARSYGDSASVETVKQLQDYSFSVTNKLVDLFLPNNTISKKVFKR